MPVCPFCGQVMGGNEDIYVLRDERKVFRAGEWVYLSPMQFKIFETLLHLPNGRTINQLMNMLYAADPNGGPVHARKNVQVFIDQANKKLVYTGLAILSARKHVRYEPFRLIRLTAIEQEADNAPQTKKRVSDD